MAFDRTAQYRAYNMASQTVAKTKQIVMLYDGAIRFMQQAKLAIVEQRIEDRYHLLNRASEIIVSLQGCLDFDNGGEIAKILHDYYSSLDARILNIHRSQSLALCDSVIDNLKEMRDSWDHVDQQQGKGGHTPQPAAEAPEPPKGKPSMDLYELVHAEEALKPAPRAATTPSTVSRLLPEAMPVQFSV